jgi:hypothetical protein
MRILSHFCLKSRMDIAYSSSGFKRQFGQRLHTRSPYDLANHNDAGAHKLLLPNRCAKLR